MKRTKPPKQKMVRSKFNGIAYKPSYLEKVLNPGSMPRKWDRSMARRAMFLASLGLLEVEIAMALDVHEHSINYWKRTKPEFFEALQKGKDEYTERVEQAVVRSAVGYSHPAIQFNVIDDEVIQTPYTKHYPPNATIMMYYLSNRARHRWGSAQKIEGTINHRHILDLTDLTEKELTTLESIGLKRLPEHGSND